MRIRELHLKAFGAFTGRTIDLSGGQQGLHLIYGPNEAGKSTALRAITQLLYGIPARTGDDFQHPMANLRIGATLENGKDSLSFVRRKGNKNTILSADERDPLPDGALDAFLGGVDQAAFENFFGLSHAQLVGGGEALVQGHGDVGQALFSAAAGLGHLRELLGRLESDAADLFSPLGKKPRINHALGALKNLRSDIKAAQLSTKDWKALDAELRDLESRRDEIGAALAAARAEEARLKRLHDALPLVARRADGQARLEHLAGAVLLPRDFSERRLRCQTEAAHAQAVRDAARKALEKLDRELAEAAVDAVLLAHEEPIEELNERRAQVQKALSDVERELAPALARLETEAVRELQQLRPHWTLDQVEELRLAPGQAQRINELSRAGEALKAQFAAADDALKKWRRERDRKAEALQKHGPVSDTAAAERALKQAARDAAAEQDREARAREASDLAAAIDAAIARLGLWSGDSASLEALPVPSPATIERFRIDLGDARKQCAARREASEALASELRQAESELAALRRAHDAPSLDALEGVRRERQAGWKLAREAWEAGIPPEKADSPEARGWLASAREAHPDAATLADAYAALVESADVVADRLRNEADRVAARAQLESAIESLGQRLNAARAAETKQAEALKAIEAAWKAAWAPADIVPRSPEEMAEWKQAHAALLDSIQAHRDAESAAHAFAATAEAARGAINAALAEAGAPPLPGGCAIADAIARAEEWIEAQRAAREARDQTARQLEALERETIPEAEDARNRAEERLAEWRAEWGALAEALGLSATASPGEVLAVVDAINGLLGKAEKADEYRGRIARIRRDGAAFEEDVRKLLAAAAPDRTGGDAVASVQALYAALKQARAARQTRDGLEKQRESEAGRMREAEVTLAQVNAEREALCAEAGVADPEDLPRAEKASEARRQLESELSEVEARLLALSAGAGLEALLAMAEGADADAIGAKLPELADTITDLDGERLALQERIGDRKAILGQMDGRDTAAALEEEAQSVIAGLEEDVAAYARLKLAAHVLRTAIEQYRAANEEPMLARAGQIFHTLTLGAFAELRADVTEKDEHVLCGVRADSGTPVRVEGMSEGTADQLYLALRIASLERHLERHAPLPFILDDILVNFDDQRAAAALDVLAEVSRHTQVIYFTHHQHLLEIARECVDEKRLFVQSLTG